MKTISQTLSLTVIMTLSLFMLASLVDSLGDDYLRELNASLPHAE